MTTTTRSATRRYYYAARWTYGGRPSTTIRRHGAEITVPACQFVRFSSQAERDAWVAAGPSYVSERGYREAVTTLDSYLRQAIRWAEQDLAEDGYTSHLVEVDADPLEPSMDLAPVSR